ncbi:MAG: protoporphyrinogen oxidase [Nitriliruptoraceae bacterium]
MSPRRRIGVVGGGITGLATAWRLRDHADVTVFEASDRLGGAVRTIDFDGAAFDVGADALLARNTPAHAWLADLGFSDDDLVSPATADVLLWRGRRPRRLPEHTMLGAPSDLVALARSTALSPAALARAALEPLVARGPIHEDVSVGEFLSRRFGRAVVDTLVEPLLGGVYAGRADRLSLQAAAAPLWQTATTHRSMLQGLAAARRERPATDGPVFVTVREGLSTLVDRLVGGLGDRVRRSAPVTAIEPVDGRWSVRIDHGDAVVVDEVVLAVPAAVAARLLAPVVADVAAPLGAIPTASVAVVALAYVADDTANLPHASGLLVPRRAARLVKAVTFSSKKWPHHAGHPRTLIRASVGRIDDDRHVHLDDESLARQVDHELREMLRFRAPAVRTAVVRWPDALPQYDVGHTARVQHAQQLVATHAPGVHLAGAAIGGVGVAARIAQADALAAALQSSAKR